MGNRGQDMMFVGYPFNQESDSVRMWNPLTNRVVITQDIIWMQRMFYEVEKSIELVDNILTTDDAVEDVEEEVEAESNSDNESVDGESITREADTESAIAPQITRIDQIIHQPERLIESMAAKAELQGIVVELRYPGSMAELVNT